MGLKNLYDRIIDLQLILKTELQVGEDLSNNTVDYRHIKALAATYELQEYIAGRIATEIRADLMDPGNYV